MIENYHHYIYLNLNQYLRHTPISINVANVTRVDSVGPSDKSDSTYEEIYNQRSQRRHMYYLIHVFFGIIVLL